MELLIFTGLLALGGAVTAGMVAVFDQLAARVSPTYRLRTRPQLQLLFIGERA